VKYFLMWIVFFSSLVLSQNKNKIIQDSNSEPMLIGYCTREAFNDSVFASWFDLEYKGYNPDSSTIIVLKEEMKDVAITLVMGSWCDDSKIYVPRLYKILDLINYPTEEITLNAVNEDKKTEGDEIDGLAIDLVPTIIFHKNNSELGRIVEMPNESIEEDMLRIVSLKDNN